MTLLPLPEGMLLQSISETNTDSSEEVDLHAIGNI